MAAQGRVCRMEAGDTGADACAWEVGGAARAAPPCLRPHRVRAKRLGGTHPSAFDGRPPRASLCAQQRAQRRATPAAAPSATSLCHRPSSATGALSNLSAIAARMGWSRIGLQPELAAAPQRPDCRRAVLIISFAAFAARWPSLHPAALPTYTRASPGCGTREFATLPEFAAPSRSSVALSQLSSSLVSWSAGLRLLVAHRPSLISRVSRCRLVAFQRRHGVVARVGCRLVAPRHRVVARVGCRLVVVVTATGPDLPTPRAGPTSPVRWNS